MPTEFEATLRLKGKDETAEAYAQAARNARRFQQEQTRASRQMEVDINSIGRAFRGLRRAMTVGGVTGILTGAIKEAADFNDKLTRIGVNARLTEPQLKRLAEALRAEAGRANIAVDKVVDGFEAWREASGQSTDEALRSFTLITDGATRFNAEVTSVANLAGKLQTNFRLTGNELEAAFDQMAVTIGGAPFDEVASNFADMSEDLRKLGHSGEPRDGIAYRPVLGGAGENQRHQQDL